MSRVRLTFAADAVVLIFLALPTPLLAQVKEVKDYAYLGVYTEPIRPGDDSSGLKVRYVVPGSAAGTMGLKKGDEIVALNDIIISDLPTFVRELRREKVGAKIRFLLRRGGEKVKLRGKIGSYVAHQTTVRKRIYGRPLLPLPPVKWWDAEKRKWIEKKSGLAHFEGKVGIIFSFDDCPRCTQKRYQPFIRMKPLLESQYPNVPLALVGLYQSEPQDERGESADRARKLFEAYPSPVPVGLVQFPAGSPPSPEEREERLYLHKHGIVVLDSRGKVRYTQIFGLPEQEFLAALGKIFKELDQGGKDPPPAGPIRKPPTRTGG